MANILLIYLPLLGKFGENRAGASDEGWQNSEPRRFCEVGAEQSCWANCRDWMLEFLRKVCSLPVAVSFQRLTVLDGNFGCHA